jgi:hypothetical protein
MGGCDEIAAAAATVVGLSQGGSRGCLEFDIFSSGFSVVKIY